MSFADKVILITGANSGIGQAAAEYFAKEGAKLALVGRRAEKFENVVKNIKESGVELDPLIIVADVTIDAERIMNETIEAYGRLDVLINNAGFAIISTIEDLQIEDFDAVMSTNVRAVIVLTKLAMPHLIATKGNVVNISSALSTIAANTAFAYSMSKASLDHFTRCAAMELAAKGVRVNSVNPAVIDTAFYSAAGIPEELQEGLYEEYKKKHPLQRIGYCNDVVHAIAYLASDKAAFVTSELLRVDGGISNKGVFD